ncbi:hypothetical protein NPIL_558171 [Nephila pilipes]|uniref:Uncharacterized protein n=1 Tax=Nephila pilipes TaxID=299642 RepID=A0A8X6P680_NEPPI|nr:hypothetical protein NPIL_558171 [Nephila pilipes]
MVDWSTVHFRSAFGYNRDPFTRTHDRILGPSFKTSPVEDLPTHSASLNLLSTPARGRPAPRALVPNQINGGEALEGIVGTENRRVA